MLPDKKTFDQDFQIIKISKVLGYNFWVLIQM